MDRETLSAYDAGAAAFAQDWHDQPAPADLHAVVRRFFRPGRSADIGCGSGREVAFLVANGFEAVGYDASEALLAQARARYPGLSFEAAALPELEALPESAFDNVLCETVVMHLPLPQIAPAVRRLVALLKPGGVLYLSWRVTARIDATPAGGSTPLSTARWCARCCATPLLLDRGRGVVRQVIHRIVARRRWRAVSVARTCQGRTAVAGRIRTMSGSPFRVVI